MAPPLRVVVAVVVVVAVAVVRPVPLPALLRELAAELVHLAHKLLPLVLLQVAVALAALPELPVPVAEAGLR